MLTIDPKEVTTPKLHGYLQSAVGPRPIALASTVDRNGVPNLSPFSFFNIFSSNPPILIFSPSRRVRDNTVKHTLLNAELNREVVINVVSYGMVEQTSLSSTEYEAGVNEFEKAGFNMIPSDMVKPPRVQQAPVQFECRVNDIIAMGDKGGAGNLILCEVLKMHIDESILDENGNIDQYKIDLVSRLGGNWYSRSREGLFEVEKPLTTLGIGVDAIPEFIKNSTVFDGNDMGKLGNTENLPTPEEIDIFVKDSFEAKALLSADDEGKRLLRAKEYLDNNEVATAWKLLLAKK
ncbi:flavin reductase family protein [Flavobacterium psychrotrophum]|uniref:flavin reductase family protein n=1 Tax=Flavobacterium psychrotrophum TaxID=2294119 RepID=UPI000E313B44|nr:flavin reductase family protein [Flavobacterium psychrotrophum]